MADRRPRPRKAQAPVEIAAATTAPSPSIRRAAWAIVLAAVLLTGLVRLRLADMPLERDEGEYAYAGQLIREGVAPYALVYNMKFPGTYYAYALAFAIGGESVRTVHVALLAVNAATIVVLFLLGRRLLGDWPGAVAALAFAVLSLDRWTAGPTAHATHFLLLPLLAGVWLLARAAESPRTRLMLGAGLLFGVAVTMKQQAAIFLPMAVATAWWMARKTGQTWTWRHWLTLTAGLAVPFVVMIAELARHGVLDRFWFWTFTYARAYVSETSVSDAVDVLIFALGFITQATVWWWTLAVSGLVLLFWQPWPARARVEISGLLVAGFLTACPGFYFRPHYFIPMLPAVALLCGVAVAGVARAVARFASSTTGAAVAGLLVAGLSGTYVAHESDYLIDLSPRALSKNLSGANPFVEAEEIAAYLRAHTNESETIGVLGSEPEIFFLAHRRSASGYIYTYALMEPQPYASRMQAEMIEQIERAHPKYLVVVLARVSWLARPESDQRIATWTQQYAATCYDRVGAGDLSETEHTQLHWNGDVAAHPPTTTNQIYILQRKSDSPCTITK